MASHLKELTHEEQREQIKKDIEAFLAAGGQIETLPPSHPAIAEK